MLLGINNSLYFICFVFFNIITSLMFIPLGSVDFPQCSFAHNLVRTSHNQSHSVHALLACIYLMIRLLSFLL